jgi:dihydrolipoamide dehydrogenase
MAKKTRAEFVVIGAGPGGYTAAFRLADLGKGVLLIDRDPTLGGVCLNRGCIPSKALLHVSKIMNEAKELSKSGVIFGKPKIDLGALRKQKDKTVRRLVMGLDQMARARKIKTLEGHAAFNSNTELSVKTANETINVSFEKCIIAVGSVSSGIPGVPMDHPSVLTSKTALELKEIPETMLVIGGGAVGLELGQVYATLGTKVTIVEFMQTLIPAADFDIVEPLRKKLERQGITVLLSSRVKKVEIRGKSALSVSIQNGERNTKKIFDRVLVAVGRTPNKDLLNLEKTDVATDDSGYIRVDEYQRTSIDTIFAIGDIVGHPMLAHKASHQGKVAAEVAAGKPAVFDASAIPNVVYTDPEVAWAGLTEKEAKEMDIAYKTGEFPWAASGKAAILGASEGKTKILFDSDTQRILGIGIVGPGAGDLIAEGALAIEMGADAEDIGLTVHPHPTMSETIGNASEMVTGTVTDIYLNHKD